MQSPRVRRRNTSVVITGAAPALSAEQAVRMRRYVWSMGIRTGCFVAAVATDGVWRWLFVFAAVVLPYVAVVAANTRPAPPRASPVSPGSVTGPALPAWHPEVDTDRG